MLIVIIFISLLFVFLLSPMQTHAIVVLPAIILIPIAHMVAVVMVAIGIPIASMGILIKTVSNNHRLAIVISIGIFIAVILLSLLILRIKFPYNPLF